jgi:hypothetical protein
VDFEEFYPILSPLTKKAYAVLVKYPGRLVGIAHADIGNLERLLVRSQTLDVLQNTIKVLDVMSFRKSRFLQQISGRLFLEKIDCGVGVCQYEVGTLVLAHYIPERARTKVFADYARSLSLPHIAEVIDVAARDLPPTLQIAPQP